MQCCSKNEPRSHLQIHNAAFLRSQSITPHQILLYVMLNFWPKLVHCIVLLKLGSTFTDQLAVA